MNGMWSCAIRVVAGSSEKLRRGMRTCRLAFQGSRGDSSLQKWGLTSNSSNSVWSQLHVPPMLASRQWQPPHTALVLPYLLRWSILILAHVAFFTSSCLFQVSEVCGQLLIDLTMEHKLLTVKGHIFAVCFLLRQSLTFALDYCTHHHMMNVLWLSLLC